MERLTVNLNDDTWALKRNTDESSIMLAIARLAAYEDTGLSPETVSDLLERFTYFYRTIEGLDIVDPVHFGAFVDRVKHWAQAEKDGRLVVLPCKVGNTVYEINKRGFVSTYKVISIHISDCSILVGWELIDGIYSNLNGFEVSALGKTVFLTVEEAEAALKKRRACELKWKDFLMTRFERKEGPA